MSLSSIAPSAALCLALAGCCLGPHVSEHALAEYQPDVGFPAHAPRFDDERASLVNAPDPQWSELQSGSCPLAGGAVTWFEARRGPTAFQTWAYVGERLAFIETHLASDVFPFCGSSTRTYGIAPRCTPRSWAPLSRAQQP